jgi:hypothetical protein
VIATVTADKTIVDLHIAIFFIHKTRSSRHSPHFFASLRQAQNTSLPDVPILLLVLKQLRSTPENTTYFLALYLTLFLTTSKG